MMENSWIVAPVVAGDLDAAERTALQSTRDLAQLIVSTTEANLNLPIAPFTSVRPLVVIHEAMASALNTQQMLRKAHAQLEIIGRKLGLDETMWGGMYPKPDMFMSDQPITAASASEEMI